MEAWWTEKDYRNVSLSFRVKGILFDAQSRFQKIEIIDTEEYGKLLALDGCVMVTDEDEFVYHEMISHPALSLHHNPRRVLIIGGGDGGTAREVVRHSCVESVTVCEIDELVIDVSRRYFPNISSGFLSPKVDVQIRDGIQFVKDSSDDSFDVVIVDSTDPIGPGEGLFTPEFYQQVRRIVGEKGVVVCQSETPWFPQEDLTRINQNLSTNFEYVAPYIGSIPTYPRGMWSWTIASDRLINAAQFRADAIKSFEGDLRYLNQDLLDVILVVPSFVREKFRQAKI